MERERSHSHILECADAIPFDRLVEKECREELLRGWPRAAKAPLCKRALLGLDELLANLLLGETALARVGVHQGDDELALLHGRPKLYHAILGRDVAVGAEDEHGPCASNVLVQVVDVLQIVDTASERDANPLSGIGARCRSGARGGALEKDFEIGHHLEQPLLDHAHLILIRCHGAPLRGARTTRVSNDPIVERFKDKLAAPREKGICDSRQS